jgi:hypothetical protein
MSIREITEEQFSDGTTIDGSRIEKSLDDMSERFSSVPKGDLLQGHMQTQIVCGWSPPTAASGTSHTNEIPYPWLLYLNSVSQSSSPYDNDGLRFKGSGKPTEAIPFTSNSSQYGVTIPIELSQPAVIESVNITMLTHGDGYYKWNIADFMGVNTANTSMNPQVLMMVDNPFLSEDPSMSSLVLRKNSPGYESFNLTGDANDLGEIPAVDMAPDLPAVRLRGAYLKSEKLNIPLPASSRIRFALISKNNAFFGPNYNMWSAFSPTIVVTLLEPLANG